MDGSNGGTSFPDASQSNLSIGVVGDAQTSTGQVKFGSAALRVDSGGSGGQLTATIAQAIGSQQFTIDCWYYNTANAHNGDIWSYASDENTIYSDHSNSYDLTWYHAGNKIQGSPLDTGNWHHMAIVGDGTNVKEYIDGTQTGSTYTGGYNLTQTVIHIGGHNAGIGVEDFNGYIDEFRISIGIQRWTSNFTPPTSAYSLPGVSPSNRPILQAVKRASYF